MSAPMSTARLRYLLTIYQLGQGGPVRSVQIADRLDVTRASVNRMLAVLTREKVVQKEHYGRVQLTAQGLELASRCWRQYSDLCQVLESRLDLPAEQLSSQAIAVVADLGPDGVQGILDSVGRPA
ncbi:metal-dependent transcriptional regulator [Neobittarella massiliensis]|uniref:metal-dependent transcriptional regulator n=1 Tax=Neobittarella massiliensis (ex Bilen et al. 2018) TaxID=2041842 RepID=UPI000CF62276|nr:metal-dependent transcriptional regulator [Neobittarella massiliensis]